MPATSPSRGRSVRCWALSSSSSSFKALDENYRFPPSLLPHRPTLENYRLILEGDNLLRYCVNSGIVTAVSVAITVVLSLFGAYAFARFEFPLRSLLLLLILIPRIIPSITRVVPL